MTYVSHTVRSLRRDPVPGETVRLVLTPAENTSAEDTSAEDTPAENTPSEEIADAVESLGGEVVRDLQFDRLLVEVEQSELVAICELDEVSVVESDAVLDQT
jgi:hypothetical protein